MPYIKGSEKERFLFSDGVHRGLKLETADRPGELNYIVTCFAKDYLDRKGWNYTNMNEVLGALECAKLELYRRKAAPYEDQKIKENGDVY